MITTLIPREGLPEIWPRVAKMLDRALGATKLRRATNLQLYEGCLNGAYDLWVVFSPETKEIVAAFTTQVIQYPAYKALSVQYLGGKKMREWFRDAHNVLVRFARDLGCATIEGYGRKAWLRVLNNLTDHKWREVYVMFETEVSPVEQKIAAE